MVRLSRSPTGSVSPPQTPDSSDPFRYSLPVSEDSWIRELHIRLDQQDAKIKEQDAKIEKIDAMIKEIDAMIKEIDAMIKEHDADIEEHDAEIEELKSNFDIQDAELSGLAKDKNEHAKIPGNLIGSNIFDKLVEDLNSQGVPSMVEKINSYDNDNAISKKVLGVSVSEAEETLNTLVIYLKAKNDPKLDDLFVELFSKLKPFALEKVTSSNKTLETRKVLNSHILKTSEKFSKRVEPSFEFFEGFVRTFHPKFVQVLPLLLSKYDPQGERRILGDYLDHVLDFINRYRELRFKLIVIEQFSIGNNTADFAVLKGGAEFLFIEIKATFGIGPSGLDGMESLPKSLDPILKQVFDSQLERGIRKAIVTDGIVYIKLDISEEKFFAKRTEFMKSHIVPYQFQIMHFKGALFFRRIIDWVLEAEGPGNSKIKEMETFYQSSTQKRREKPARQQKNPKKFISKSSRAGYRRYSAKKLIAYLFGAR